MSDVFKSERHFQVWAYSVTKCRLLIRSTIEGGLPSRIDLYFGGVDRVLLRPDYDGLTVAEADDVERKEYLDRYGELVPGLKLFTLEPGLASFVVAGVVQWHEDAGGFREPSYFGRFPGA